jgi:hypothetical protein
MEQPHPPTGGLQVLLEQIKTVPFDAASGGRPVVSLLTPCMGGLLANALVK